MSPDRILRDTLANVLAELDRLDPQSLTAARAHGVLEAIACSAPSSKGGRPRGVSSRQAEKDAPLIASYQSGKTAGEVAEAHGCERQTVYNALRRAGIPSRARGHTIGKIKPAIAADERIERIRTMRADGRTLEEIGAAEKITRERVRQLCQKAGIPTPRPELTQQEKDAVAAYLAGDSIDQASAGHDIAPSRLNYALARMGHSPRPSKRTCRRSAQTVAKASLAGKLYLDGKKLREISAALGLGKPEMVYRYLAVAGVKPHRRAHSAAATRAA